MGNQKQKWTREEEEALLAGIAKHGPGKWKNILKDPDFAPFLTHRSNIDLKDKWRNLSVSTSAGSSRDKSRAPKVKAIIASLPNTPDSAAAASCAGTTDTVVGDPSNSVLDGKIAPRYNTMIFEALSTIKDTNGSDIGAIISYIEQRHEVPPNFRRLLSARLRRLVSQGKLEKIQNCYKIKKDTLTETNTPTPKQEDMRLGQNYDEEVEAAAAKAAALIVDSHNKSLLAEEAVKEAERVSQLAEKTKVMLWIVEEIYERCSRGEVVYLAP